jgi:hypothetical protein
MFAFYFSFSFVDDCVVADGAFPFGWFDICERAVTEKAVEVGHLDGLQF